MTTAVDVGAEKVPETVVDFGARSSHAHVLTDCATTRVLQVLDGLEHVDAVIVVDVQTAVSGAFGRQAALPTGRFIVVVIGIVVLKLKFEFQTKLTF